VDDYLHEVLAAADAACVEQHCQGCRICTVALDEARKRFAAMETLPASEASGQLIQATLQKIANADRTGSRRRKLLVRGLLVATAASVAFIGALHLYYLNLSASPFDLRLLGQAELLAGTDGSLRVQLTNHDTGDPLPGVPVDIELRDNSANEFVRLASFTTNVQGTGQPRFRLPDWIDGSYELRISARPSGSVETLTETIQLKRSWKVMLTSDKPVYQPGQTIHLRSLALRRPDLRPVAGQDAVFSVSDPKGNVVYKRQQPTSKYGIAATDCALADELIEGAYTISCKVGDTASDLTVDVKKYVLPKFKIAVELNQPYYQPGQTVHGKVHADYFFGKPVTDGQVAIEVRTNDVAPSVYRKLTAQTNPQGDASFSFPLPASLIGVEQNSGDARIFLSVTVTDSAGQLHIEVIPEAGTLVRGIPNKVFLFVSYADGRPAQARLVVSVSGVEEELITNALGVASFELKPESREGALTVRARDAQGQMGRRHVNLAADRPDLDFLVRTDKAVYDGGETIHLVALGGGVERVFVDFIKDGQTALTANVELKAGRGEYAFDLPPDLFGTVECCAYRLGRAGLAVRTTRLLYIRPAQQLDIKTALDHAEYRPGKQAKLQISLTDGQGRPVPGALSLAAVDEAVFSVMDQAPGMEKTFYMLEQKLLQPIYAIYPAWPNLPPGGSPAERNQFEQALFARALPQDNRDSELRQLLPLLDNDERILEVLKRPDWETLVDRSSMSPEIISMLRHGISPHTLSGTSYTNKSRTVEATKKTLLGVITTFWLILAAAFPLVALYRSVGPGVFVLLIVFLILLLGLLLPATQYVREASNRMQALNQLKQLGLAAIQHSELEARLKKGEQMTGQAGQPAHVRSWFPETLLWRPEIITDDSGRATVDVDLADSITTWRLLASAVSADGRLGATQAPIRVFQPFFVDLNLPVALTRGDEVAVPVVLYNYLDKTQTVELDLGEAPWFTRLEDAKKRITLAAGEVRSTAYRIRAMQVGIQQLCVTAQGSGVADALKRQIEIVPDGRRVEQVFNGTLQRPAEIALAVPEQAIPGSVRAILKIYPSSFSQLVEGLDSIFRMPSGCFEQTSSTTYPNILALDYLRRTNKSVPEVEAKARQYIHLGYQRLLTFEVAGGGFDWFGRAPANRTLTAYGLMEFQDMAKVHDVDPQLIERTRKWLLQARNQDGSWSPESHGMHEDPTRRAGDLARLSTTAYIAWAVFSDADARSQALATLDYLLAHDPTTLSDPYVLALICNALLALDPDANEVKPYLKRLDSLKNYQEDGKLAWWQQGPEARTAFYGSGRSGSIETTALAALAMVQAGYNPGTTRAALSWITTQKDAFGNWHSTQATVLALKALLAGTGKPLGGDQERRVEIAWGKDGKREVIIPADQADVMQQLDLTEQVGHGAQQLVLTDRSDTAAGYQLAFRYHVPGIKERDKAEPLSIELNYDRTDLAVGDTVTATATVVNKMTTTAPMVILDLPIPAGFALVPEDLIKLQAAGLIAKYQVTPRQAIIYLRGLEPSKPLVLRYQLRATMPVKVNVAGALVYEYYDRDKQGGSLSTMLTVSPKR
jgi:hypothetical protein